MSILTRHLLRAHLPPLLFAFVALTGVVLINTLARSLADLAGKGLPGRLFVEFFLLSLPANVALTLPMAVLVAVLYVFAQLSAENEITALRASGVDLRRMALPLLVAAAILSGAMVWFNNSVLPAANYRWRTLMMDVAQTSPLLLVQPGSIMEINTGDGAGRYFLQATKVDHAGGRLREVTIHDVSDPNRSRTIVADSARMRHNRAGTDLGLVLYDGHLREVGRGEPESFLRMEFAEHSLHLPGIRRSLDRSAAEGHRTDRELSTAMMQARIDSLRSRLGDLRRTGHEGDTRVAPSMGTQEELIHFQIRELEVEIEKKYAIAVAPLVFVLLGVPLGLRWPRGGVGMVIAASLAIFAVYYVGLIGGETLGNDGYVPPWIAMWVTNTVFGVIGGIGFWKLGREQSTARGGGFALRWPAALSSRSLPRAPES